MFFLHDSYKAQKPKFEKNGKKGFCVKTLTSWFKIKGKAVKNCTTKRDPNKWTILEVALNEMLCGTN